MKKVLIADKMSIQAEKVFTANGINFDKKIGLSEEEMQLDSTMSLDCNNCFKPIPKWILEDAGDVFFLGDYECEHCGEPLG